MKYWYADDSEFYSNVDINQPDVFVFGGIVVDDQQIIALRERIEGVKAKYCDSRAPVKYNMKDLRSTYKKANAQDCYKSLLDNSQEVRREILKAVEDVDYEIIVSGIESVCSSSKMLKEKKSELSSFAFVMGLMRFGIEIKESDERGMVILDWPDKGDNTNFNREYARAFNNGKSLGNQKYNCGPLSKIGFNDSVLYTTMINSTALQLSDIIVGITRDHLETYSKPQKETDFKKEMFDMLIPKFRGYPKFFQKGLIISSNSPKLHKAVKDGCESLQLSS